MQPLSRTPSNSEVKDQNNDHTNQQARVLYKKVCRFETLTLFFGTTLIISGIALLILESVYGYDFNSAGVSAAATGMTIFTLGFLFNCCVKSVKLVLEKGTSSSKKIETKTIPKVLDAHMNIKEYFEKQGVFGTPQDLINELEIWRNYRLNPNNFNIDLSAGFILDGPAGTGKTTICKMIADILGGVSYEINCGTLKNMYYGATEDNMTKMFTNIPKDEFRIIFIDEIDGLLPARRNGNEHDTITNHFFGAVPGKFNKNPKLLLIGATNNYNALDTAVTRPGRLDKRFIINKLNEDDRIKLFKFEFANCERSNEDWDDFIKNAVLKPNWDTGSKIKQEIIEARKKALLAKREIRIEDFNVASETQIRGNGVGSSTNQATQTTSQQNVNPTGASSTGNNLNYAAMLEFVTAFNLSQNVHQ